MRIASAGAPCYLGPMPTVEKTLLEVALPPFVQKEDARLLLAVKLFETGRLSFGQAAEMARMSKRGFLDTLGEMGVPVAGYPETELAAELNW